MFKLRQKVRITSEQKTDGRFNEGRIVGIELLQDGYFLGYKNEKEFMERFNGRQVRYTVAYIDCFTKQACVREFSESELESCKRGKRSL